MTWKQYLEACKGKTKEEQEALYKEYVKAYRGRLRTEGPLVVAKFATHISALNFPTIGLDGDLGMDAIEDDGQFWVRVDCSDTFAYACSDCESISSLEDLDLFLKVSNWFSEEYLPHIHNGREYDFFGEENEQEYTQWVGKAYCYLKREGKEDFIGYHQERYPAWLRKKLEEEAGKTND